MSVSTTLHRHKLILQRLRKGPASVPEILDYIIARFEDDHELMQVSSRTFHRDKADMLKLYRIELKYHRTDKKYYLDDDQEPYLSSRILEAFDIANMLNQEETTASGHVFFERRRPQGTEYFGSLLYAIRNKLMVQYKYQNYSDPVVTNRTVYPYALIESNGRWYLKASESKEGIVKTFGLDRISDLDITTRSFKVPKGFNPELQFRDCFGITSPNSDAPSEIVLSYEPVAGKYIKSFPLHPSQQILVDNEEELRIRLKVYLTREFVMEVLKYGASVLVMEPVALVEIVRGELLRSLERMEGRVESLNRLIVESLRE